MADKAPGRGSGKFAVAGHEQDQENRLMHLEDYLADLIDDGLLPAPVGSESEVDESETPTEG